MSRLFWEPTAFADGVDRGVLYLDGQAVVWNGLVSVEETAVASVDSSLYFDGVRRYLGEESSDFSARVSAYTYPSEFFDFSGYSESLGEKRFGFSYRSGKLLHLVYNATVTVDTREYETLTQSPSAPLMSWNLFTTPVLIPGARPTSHFVIDTSESPQAASELELMLYGTEESAPYLPDPLVVLELFDQASILQITYNGDGSWTATGPDSMVNTLPDGSFEITSPTAIPLDEDTFTVHSY